MISKYAYHWPLYLVSLILLTLLAFAYLQSSNPLYTIKASIIIKDEKKGPDIKEQFQDLDLGSSPKLAENEVGVLKSHYLISRVINALHLQVTYTTKDGLRTEDLYGKTPVIFNIIDSTSNFTGHTFKLKIRDYNSFLLLNAYGKYEALSFKQVVTDSICTWRLEPTPLLNRYIGKELSISIENLNKVTEKYQDDIDADLPDKLAPTIELTFKDNVEQRGKDVLNNLIRFYNQSTISDKDRTTKKTLRFLDNRIAELSSGLNNSEQAVQGFKSSEGLADISQQSKVYLENAQANDNKLNDINIQLNIITGIEQNIESGQNVQSASASLGVAYPSLNSLIERLSALQAQRDKLLANTPEANPIFDPINRQIKTLKGDIRDNILNIKSSMITTKNKLESYNTKVDTSIRSVPVQERQLVDKTRDQSIKENLYVYLLQKREEVSFNYSSIVPDTRVVDYAYSGSAKSSKRPLILGFAFLLGLILPSGLIYTRNLLNNKIINSDEIENGTGIPVFAELSYSDQRSSLVTVDRSNMLLGEEFRSLRTNLQLLNTEQKKGWTTLFTSSLTSEGKSFVTSNTAVVLAASAKKTVILEMDLRKPKISTIFSLKSSHPGITDYITGKSSLNEIIQPSGVNPDLFIIGSGFIADDPSELLERPEVGEMMQYLKSEFDHILIDTPPINLVTDAGILSKFTDVNFYVIRQAYTLKSLLPFIKNLYNEDTAKKTKLIFNGVENGRYGYNNSYDNSYYRDVNKKGLKKRFSLKRLFKRF